MCGVRFAESLGISLLLLIVERGVSAWAGTLCQPWGSVTSGC